MAEQHDMIVVGAGWYGLSAARHYIELHPTEDVVVLEAESSCGGTWSENRIYAGLKSNNLSGTYEFPGFPMSEKTYGTKPMAHIPGNALHQYLTDFAQHFGVYERTRFNTRVDTLEPGADGGWTLQVTTTTGPSPAVSSTLQTKKIILATGLTSQPNFPSYPGAASFNAPHFHAKDFCRLGGATLRSSRRAVVIGGAKSAIDVAYAYAVAGVGVDMVVRTSGTGPVWLAPTWVMGGRKRLEKLLHVRWMTWFSPCAWGGADGWGWARRFLHGTALGRFVVRQFWAGLEGEVVKVNGYDEHAEVGKLKPWHSAFWIGSGLSLHNYDESLWEKIRNGEIRVHVADVERLSDHAVHLSDGQVLEADVLVCSTGWRKESSIRFVGFGDAGIGLPQTAAERAKLAEKADAEILSAYPSLRDQPDVNPRPKSDPLRLYRFMVPPARMGDRNIAFAGMVSSVSTSITATVQGLWISAFFDGCLDREARNIDEVTEEVMLHTQFGRWRHPTGYGASLPDFAFDSLPYIDLIVKDLGLKVNRKAGWADVTEPYGPEDYVSLIDEWRSLHKGKA